MEWFLNFPLFLTKFSIVVLELNIELKKNLSKDSIQESDENRRSVEIVFRIIIDTDRANFWFTRYWEKNFRDNL